MVNLIKKGKIVTNYLSNMKYLEGYERYIIMRNPVRGVSKGNHICKELSPSQELLNKYKTSLSFDKFREEYLTELKRNKKALEEILLQIYKGVNIAFICCEKDDSVCHRSVLAEFIKEEYSIEVEEFKVWKKISEL